MALSIPEYDVLFEAIGSAKAQIIARAEPGDAEGYDDREFLLKLQKEIGGKFSKYIIFSQTIKIVTDITKKWKERPLNKFSQDLMSSEEFLKLHKEYRKQQKIKELKNDRENFLKLQKQHIDTLAQNLQEIAILFEKMEISEQNSGDLFVSFLKNKNDIEKAFSYSTLNEKDNLKLDECH